MTRIGFPLAGGILVYKALLMTSDPSSLGQLATWTAAGIVFVASILDKVSASRKKAKLEQSSDLLSESTMWKSKAEMLGAAAADNLKLYQSEREEHKKTRDFWHDENGKSQKILAEANLKVLELQDRPDMRDILREMKAQGEALRAQGDGIKEILLLLTQKHII